MKESEKEKRKMKIILHCNEYTPNLLPGTKRIRVFYQYLKERGHDVTVLTSSANLYNHKNEQFDKDGIIYCSAVPLKKKNLFYRILNPVTFNISALLNAKKIKRADIVLTTSPPILINKTGYIISKMLHAKLVYDVRDIWPDVALEMGSFAEDSIYFKIFRKIADFMYKSSDAITAVSPGKVKKIKKYVPNDETDKVFLIENGLDENFLKQTVDSTVIKKYDLEGKFTVIYTGNIGLAQNLQALLNLAEKVDKTKTQFLIFGDGAERIRLEQYARENNINNVRFEGIVSEQTVYSLLNYVQLAYIPLINSNLKDSVPTKTYEALGVGCPVLMIASGDAAELMKECKLGVCVDPDKLDDLENTFDYIYKNYDDIITNKDYARGIIFKHHSRQQCAKELEKILIKLCEG